MLSCGRTIRGLLCWTVNGHSLLCLVLNGNGVQCLVASTEQRQLCTELAELFSCPRQFVCVKATAIDSDVPVLSIRYDSILYSGTRFAQTPLGWNSS